MLLVHLVGIVDEKVKNEEGTTAADYVSKNTIWE